MSPNEKLQARVRYLRLTGRLARLGKALDLRRAPLALALHESMVGAYR